MDCIYIKCNGLHFPLNNNLLFALGNAPRLSEIMFTNGASSIIESNTSFSFSTPSKTLEYWYCIWSWGFVQCKAMLTLTLYRIQIKPSGIMWTPIRYVTLYFRDRRGTASLCYRNRAENTVLMFSCRRKSYPLLCEHRVVCCIQTRLLNYHCPYIMRSILWRTFFLWSSANL